MMLRAQKGVNISSYVRRRDFIHPTYSVILIAVHLISVVVECVRPFLGYYGNLGEKIPALSGFWIISVVLQAPIQLFLAINPDIWPLPLERFAYIVNLTFIVVEVVAVTRLIRRLANFQMEQFKRNFLQKEEEAARVDANINLAGPSDKADK